MSQTYPGGSIIKAFFRILSNIRDMQKSAYEVFPSAHYQLLVLGDFLPHQEGNSMSGPL